MRRMYSENQLIKLIEQHAGEGQVLSVNGKDGVVVLDATDIKLTTNQQTIQNNFIRVDTALDGKQDQLTAGSGITIENNVISANGSTSGYYIHNVVIDIYEANDVFSITGRFQVTSEDSTPIYTWYDFVQAAAENISTVQFSGNVTFDETPKLALSPVFRLDGDNNLTVSCMATYDASTGSIDGSGESLTLTGTEAVQQVEQITDTVIPV